MIEFVEPQLVICDESQRHLSSFTGHVSTFIFTLLSLFIKLIIQQF